MIYVDSIFLAKAQDAATRRVGSRNGHRWCHLMADTPDELRAFAMRLGLRLEWAQGDHFDLTPQRRLRAVEMGAAEVPARTLVMIRRLWRERGYRL